jgi:mannose/fructose/N-acetylgalactosamine-specific phosphotransferase system component IIC
MGYYRCRLLAAIFAIAGYYQPLAAPFAESALRLPVAIANLATFALTFIASLEWRMSDVAIERQRAANCSRGKYLVLVSLLSIVSLLFLVATFFFLASWHWWRVRPCIPPCFTWLMSERVLRSA